MTVFSDVLAGHPDLQDLGSRPCPRREPREPHAELERGYLMPLSHGITTGDEMLDTWADRETVRVLEHGMHERQLAARPQRIAVPVPVVLTIPVAGHVAAGVTVNGFAPSDAVPDDETRILELPPTSPGPAALPSMLP